MNVRGIVALVRKDLLEVVSSVQVMIPLVALPLVFMTVVPTILIVVLRTVPLDQGTLQLVQYAPPGLLPAMGARAQIVYLSVVYLFAPFFMIVPVMVASIIAANSFAGEKERRTLEGLLYTPLTDLELMLGKIVAAFVPALVAAGLAFLIYSTIVNVLAWPLFGRLFFPTPNWWAMVLTLVPAASFFVVMLIVLVSSRARGYQEANSISSLLVLPIILAILGQASGSIYLGVGLVLLVAAVFAAADLVLLRVIVRTFSRERVVSHLG
jgi:ABC-type transport system involved in multi-copper enzyme maturation permease subunit